ncbi:hypothetical protein [Streptomyces sp. NPDC002994]|uniref:hypothetical protein n=1 Tax=Streptomyces sp. NPDC002994 TaxID=3154441 RepID=UPI0033B0090A
MSVWQILAATSWLAVTAAIAITLAAVALTAAILRLLYRTIRWAIDRARWQRSTAPALPAEADLATCQAIWPDPPSPRVIEAQHRLETAKPRKEEQ